MPEAQRVTMAEQDFSLNIVTGKEIDERLYRKIRKASVDLHVTRRA
jgi:hypothetical protein